ncbi:hypothetical protein [Maridesulfovibrio sp.]|uniref:hypothetical protein n=1 Tax=Maridesulfovibrio sp. TaxID=2795000 RepID=UPI002AA61103|nr:hypothetical protein [Maridesulfovibrio sp.]
MNLKKLIHKFKLNKTSTKGRHSYPLNRLTIDANDLMAFIVFNTTIFYINLYICKKSILEYINKILALNSNSIKPLIKIDDVYQMSCETITICIFLSLVVAILVTLITESAIDIFKNLDSYISKFFTKLEYKISKKLEKNKKIKDHKKISRIIIVVVLLFFILIFFNKLKTSPILYFILLLGFVLTVTIMMSNRAITVFTCTTAILLTLFTWTFALEYKTTRIEKPKSHEDYLKHFSDNSCSIRTSETTKKYLIYLKLENGLLVKDENQKYTLLFTNDIKEIQF